MVLPERRVRVWDVDRAGPDDRCAAVRVDNTGGAMGDVAGRQARSAVSGVAADLACDWHTVNDAVMLFGKLLIDDPAHYGTVESVGLDETLYKRDGPFRTPCWSTQIVDVARGQLLDVVASREVSPACAWFAQRPQARRDGGGWATLDRSAAYRVVFDMMLPTRGLSR